MSSIEIHGQQVPPPDIPDGMTVLDVVIIARAVDINDHGEMGDNINTTTSPGTTFTSAIGMLQRQLWEMEEIARQAIAEDDE